jgi:hypothetical protein
MGFAWVAPKNGSAAGERQSTSSRSPPAEVADVGDHAAGVDHVPEAQIEAVAAQRAQAGGQAVDLEVAVEGCLAAAARSPALRVQPGGQVRDRGPQAGRDRPEVGLVVRDQGRVGLDREILRKVESTARHEIPSPPARTGPGPRVCGTTRVLPQGRG